MTLAEGLAAGAFVMATLVVCWLDFSRRFVSRQTHLRKFEFLAIVLAVLTYKGGTTYPGLCFLSILLSIVATCITVVNGAPTPQGDTKPRNSRREV